MKKLFAALVVSGVAGLGFLLPDQVSVVRTIRIEAPVAAVYWQVSELRNWEKWSGLVPTDSARNLQYETGELDRDSAFCWQTSGPDFVKRRLLLTGVSFCDSVETCMSFDRASVARNRFRFNEDGRATVVEWTLQTSLGEGLFARWGALFVSSVVGPDLSGALRNLRSVVETEYGYRDQFADHE